MSHDIQSLTALPLPSLRLSPMVAAPTTDAGTTHVELAVVAAYPTSAARVAA
jgi:hypothetical protein